MIQERSSKDLQPIHLQYMNAYEKQDEISLVDLWIALLQFKSLFLKTMVLMLVIGAVVTALLAKTEYNLSSVISVGEYSDGERSIAIESVEAVINRANVLLVPSLTKKTAEDNSIAIFNTNISNPKGTRLVVFENNVIDGQREIMTQFQNKLLDSIIAAHDKLLEKRDRELREKLSLAKVTLQELESPLELERLTREKSAELKLAKIELFKLTDDDYLNQKRVNYQNNLKLREESIQIHKNQNDAFTDLVKALGNDDASSYERTVIIVRDSENRKKINELRVEKADLEQQLVIFDLELDPRAKRQQALVKATISEISLIGFNLVNEVKQQRNVVIGLENQLTGNKTRAVAIAELSLAPISTSLTKVIAVIIMVSFMIGFLVTLVAIFGSKVNEKLAIEA
jgi:hypothetical protein